MKRLLVVLVALALLTPTTARADHDADVRLAAHLGVSYAIDDITYRLSRAAFKMSDGQAQSFAAFTTLFIGIIYKAQENCSGSEMLHSTLENAVGVGAATVVRWKWDF